MKSLFVPIVVSLGVPALLRAETEPFSGKPHPIPGVVEAEHWDKGPAGIAYSDVDEENRGEDYREPTAVDIEKRDDASNGHGVGWIRAGEWLVYTVEIVETGTYRIEMPVASNKEGGLFHIEIDGRDVTGPIRIPDTGSWQQLETITVEKVDLEKGVRKMKVVMDENGESTAIGDIDLFRFVRAEG